MRADGTSDLEIASEGSLILETDAGPLKQTVPRTWEVLPDGTKRPVECRFCKINTTHYGFDLPRRDPNLLLVIDPGLEWTTPWAVVSRMKYRPLPMRATALGTRLQPE